MKLQMFFPQKLKVLKTKVAYQGIKNGPIGVQLLLAIYLDMSINVCYVLYVAEMTKINQLKCF